MFKFRDWNKLFYFRHLANKMRYTNVPGQQALNEIDAMVSTCEFSFILFLLIFSRICLFYLT